MTLDVVLANGKGFFGSNKASEREGESAERTCVIHFCQANLTIYKFEEGNEWQDQ